LLADFYVNDAFAVSHRKNASVVAVTKFLPSYTGLELEMEINTLSRVMKSARHPLVVILGGAKAGDKLGVLKYFKNKADCFLIGGAAANTLLFLSGVNMGRSLVDNDKSYVKELAKILKYKNLFLPQDLIFHNGAALDIGRRTSAMFAEKISQARTIIWNGPLGLFEKEPYGRGTLEVARAIIKNRRAFSLAGGGETEAFLAENGLNKKFGFVSTGGGAMLDFLAGKKLPGIEALKR
jgi:3-phosphoglycerate kinase